ncbi:hypothetical protein M3194_30740 [Paenibacillus glycanilyticus]|uniref:hypothetical protein n=1 Tax=Paenibacillus glycanilyticus TaxID=126569 RepID=UPI00203A95E2|nr:hypothetical protein [Paenibacillus glycanilyticus]MCM3631669.1 hypothetical protein [Paenibacillus glycanilyticus]
MGVNSKGKRKLEYIGRTYYWNVQLDPEDYGQTNLDIVSEDKKFIVSYHVGQSNNDKRPFIVVKGIEFRGLENHYRQGWVRVLTPNWDDKIITPGLVKTIIEWCLLQKDLLELVDWKGDIQQIFP